MANKEQHPQPGGEPWGVDALSAALNARARRVRDVAHGAGHRYHLGEEGQLQLDLFPAAEAVRVQSPSMRLQLYRQAPPTLDDHGIAFRHDQDGAAHTLSLSALREVRLGVTPEALQSAQGAAAAPEPVFVHSEQQRTAVEDPGATQSPSAAAPPSPETKQERLTLLARVWHTPTIRAAAKGKLVGQLALGVHGGQDQTPWHQVVACDKRVEKIRELTPGQPVEVVGYGHVSELPTKDGKGIVTKEEIYAVVVKPK